MKYVYSIIIIAIGFFAIPAVFDFSGHVADQLRLRGKDADDAPVKYTKSDEQLKDPMSIQLPKPTAVRYIKE